MNKWLAPFACVFLANTAWGQNPALPPANPAVQACPQACPTPLKTVCVPEATTRVKVSIQYSSTCEQVCPGGCRFPLLGKCQQCDGGNCGTPYTKKYLVKKIVTEDEPTVKCVPVLVPATEGHGILHRNQPALCAPVPTPQPGTSPAPIETIPVPPVPSKK